MKQNCLNSYLRDFILYRIFSYLFVDKYWSILLIDDWTWILGQDTSSSHEAIDSRTGHTIIPVWVCGHIRCSSLLSRSRWAQHHYTKHIHACYGWRANLIPLLLSFRGTVLLPHTVSSTNATVMQPWDTDFEENFASHLFTSCLVNSSQDIYDRGWDSCSVKVHTWTLMLRATCMLAQLILLQWWLIWSCCLFLENGFQFGLKKCLC